MAESRLGPGKGSTSTTTGSKLGSAQQSGLGNTSRLGPSGGAPSAPPAEAKKPSLLGQVKNTVAALPSALVGFGKEAVTEAKSYRGGGNINKAPTPHFGETQAQADVRVHPLGVHTAESFKRTAGDVIHPTHFARASQEGTIVSKVLEDAANASIVLGPVSRGAGAVAERTAATAAAEGTADATARATAARVAAKTLHGAARGTEAVAAAPVKPFQLATLGVEAGPVLSRLPGVAAGERVGLLPLAARGFDAAAQSEGRVGTLARLAKVDPQSRMLRHEALTPAMSEQSDAVGRQVRLGQQVGRAVSDPIEQQAMTVVGEGQAAALAALRAQAPDRFDAFVQRTFGDTLDIKAAHLAADVAEGKAPEVAARVDAGLAQGRTGEGGRIQRGEQYVAAKPGRDWQTGFAADQRVIDKAIEKPLAALPSAEKLARSLRAKADRATDTYKRAGEDYYQASTDLAGQPGRGVGRQLGRLETRAQAAKVASVKATQTAERADAVLGKMRERVRTTAEKAAGSVEAAPARLRPVLEVNRRATSELTDHAKTLRADGLHDAAAKVEQAAAEIPATLKALEAAGVNPDHFIHVQAGDKPTSGGARSGGLPKLTKARSERQRTDSLHFDRSVRAQTQGEIDEAKAVIARQTADKIGTMPFAAKLGAGPLEGMTTAEEAAQAGYVAWNPRTIFEKGRVAKHEQQAVAAGAEGTTTFVPQHIFDGFRSYFNDPTVDKLLRKTYDPVIQGVKVGQLALSPGWQVGNLAGNAMMATLGAGVDPVTLTRSIVQAVKEYRASGPRGERSFEAVAPRRLLTAGPTHEEFAFLRPPDEQALGRFPRLQKAASVLGKPARASYALNGFVDNVGRSAVYIAKKGQGLSDEAAVRESLKAMGDFSRMTPMERQVVRRIIPYYAWSRHITQLAFRLPIEHPLRVAWTLHLADQYADPTTRDLPGSLRGAVRLPGGKLLEPGRLFPFGDAGRVLEPNGIQSQLSPIIKIPYQRATGINLQTGKPFTRPPGTSKLDEFGNDRPTSPPVLRQIGGLFPQKRLLDAATGRDQVARYNNGQQVVTAKGPIDTGKTGGLGLLRFLGIPISDAKQAETMAERVAAKQAAATKAKASYKKRSGG